MTHFVKDLGVNIIGGCCGTNAEHIKRLSQISEKFPPAKRKWEYIPSVSSLFLLPFADYSCSVLIGERCNANGSKQFRKLLETEDYDAMVNMAKEQTKEVRIYSICP